MSDPLSGLSHETLSPSVLVWSPSERGNAAAPFGLRATVAQGSRTLYGMHRENISASCRACYGMFWGVTKGRERKGCRWFGEQQKGKQRDKREGNKKDLLPVNSWLASRLVWLCPVPHRCSLSCLLTKPLPFSFLGEGLYSMCMHMCGGSSATAGVRLQVGVPVCLQRQWLVWMCVCVITGEEPARIASESMKWTWGWGVVSLRMRRWRLAIGWPADSQQALYVYLRVSRSVPATELGLWPWEHVCPGASDWANGVFEPRHWRPAGDIHLVICVYIYTYVYVLTSWPLSCSAREGSTMMPLVLSVFMGVLWVSVCDLCGWLCIYIYMWSMCALCACTCWEYIFCLTIGCTWGHGAAAA